MSRKLKIFLSITTILLGLYLLNLQLKDDVQEIKEAVYSLKQPMTNIAHIEFLDKNQAIVFYEWGNQENLYFGAMFFKQKLLGWKFAGGSSGALAHEYKLDWGYSNLGFYFTDYTDLIRGKILDPKIEEVSVITGSGKEFKANIIEYNNEEKFWFLVSNNEDLIGSTITGLSSDGEIIEQLQQ